MNTEFRNIGIIAHVDHGKTTLVDRLLQSAGVFREHEELQDRAMDSMDLEREKGITIKSKNAAIEHKGVKINVVDTPGHADFGGEVERILKMVDGVVVLIDAAEGPQAQTRFVLRKAIENNLHLIVFINKIDRDTANPERAHDLMLELLMELHATEEQFESPFLYGSAKNNFAVHHPGDEPEGMDILLDTVLEHIPPPSAKNEGEFEMLVSNLDWNDYVGRIAVGRITRGSINLGDPLTCIHRDGTREIKKISKLYTFTGMGMAEAESAPAGEIIGMAGFDSVFIGETLCSDGDREPLPFTEVDPPTIRMEFCVNDGPFAGKEGKYVTSRHIGDRLVRETRTNISLQVEQHPDKGNAFIVSARGELQIAVVVETMRREGFELMVSRPEVIMREENGKKVEPFETLYVDIDNDHLGDVMQAIAARKGKIDNMEHVGNRVLLEATVPTRGIIGFESLLTSITSGNGICSHIYKDYAPFCGVIPSRATGSLVSMATGVVTAYALDLIQERGRTFSDVQDDVYEGMIVGENARGDDLPVNPTRTKQLTNVRASGTDKAISLEPAIKMSLERCIEFIADDEFVEATPENLRLRKKILDPNVRKRLKKKEGS